MITSIPSFLTAQNVFNLNGITLLQDSNNFYNVSYPDSVRINTETIRVRFHQGTDNDSILFLEESLGLEKLRTTLAGYSLYLLPDTVPFVDIVENLLSLPIVEKVAFNFFVPYFDMFPNDPWYYPSSLVKFSWHLNALRLPQAWEITTGDPDVIVGLLDSGVDLYHEDISSGNIDNIYYNPGEDDWNLTPNTPYGNGDDDDGNGVVDDWRGFNFYNGTPNVYDELGHGVLLSGLISAQTNNLTGIAGIAGGWNSQGVTILPVALGTLPINIIPDAINYAVNQGAKVLNFSWGWYIENDEDVDIAIRDAYHAGVTMFAAVGNNKLNYDIAWPAKHPYVIAVSALEFNDSDIYNPTHWWTYNDKGSNYSSESPLTEISCPQEVISTSTTGYDDIGQTSCATAVATGVASLMYSVNPCLSPCDVRRILTTTAVQVGGKDYYWNPEFPGHSRELGYGMIDAFAAVSKCHNPGATVTGTEVWDETVWMTGDIYIEPGATLTITDTVKMLAGKTIWVDLGGHLIVDGGVITTSCDDFWQGIKVNGANGTLQIPYSNQGMLTLKSGAIIEKAAYSVDLSTYSIYPYSGGGILFADSARFINCYTAVHFPGYYYSDVSHLTNCTFLFNDDFFPDKEPQEFIKMYFSNGVTMKNCTFINESSDLFRGTGIYALNSTFFLDWGCTNPLNPVPCPPEDLHRSLFSNLLYGMYILGSGSYDYFSLKNTDFMNNYRGLYASGIQNSQILSNRFITSQAQSSYGAYLENCTGYHIEDNSFEGDADPETTDIGLYIRNSGGDNNEVYNNRLSSLVVANVADGINANNRNLTGLCYKCNDFLRNGYDIVVTCDTLEPHEGDDYGIRTYQGYSSNSNNTQAGNLFTESFPGGIYDFKNNLSKIQYIRHNNNEIENLTPDPRLNITVLIDDDAPYVKSESCPSRIPGGSTIDPNDLRDEMNAAANNSNTLNTQLAALVDGGSTDALNMAVQTSFPNEAWQLYSDLLDKSPYLSDTVMKSSIDKEEVLPNAMIRDILVANPQSAKSQTIMEMLDERFDPMPDEMKVDIEQGKNILGSKEMMEMNISAHRAKYSTAFSELTNLFLFDTVHEWSVDSLIEVLEDEGSLSSRYSIAALYSNLGFAELAYNNILSIPSQYVLTQQEEIIQQDYENYYSLMLSLVKQNKTVFDADSLIISGLFNLTQNRQYLPGVFARNVLIAIDQLNYQEPLNLPQEQYAGASFNPSAEKEDKTVKNKTILKIFPNPAKTYIIVYYKTTSKNHDLSLTMYDHTGRNVYSIKLEKTSDQIVIPINNFASGTYFVGIVSERHMLNSTSVSIIR